MSKSEKEYAAICYALACTRGLLHSVLSDDYDRDNIQKLLDATAIEQIAKSINVRRSELEIDWNETLSETEKMSINGIYNRKTGNGA